MAVPPPTTKPDSFHEVILRSDPASRTIPSSDTRGEGGGGFVLGSGQDLTSDERYQVQWSPPRILVPAGYVSGKRGDLEKVSDCVDRLISVRSGVRQLVGQHDECGVNIIAILESGERSGEATLIARPSERTLKSGEFHPAMDSVAYRTFLENSWHPSEQAVVEELIDPQGNLVVRIKAEKYLVYRIINRQGLVIEDSTEGILNPHRGPFTRVCSYDYDPEGRITRFTQNIDGHPDQIRYFHYDADGVPFRMEESIFLDGYDFSEAFEFRDGWWVSVVRDHRIPYQDYSDYIP